MQMKRSFDDLQSSESHHKVTTAKRRRIASPLGSQFDSKEVHRRFVTSSDVAKEDGIPSRDEMYASNLAFIVSPTDESDPSSEELTFCMRMIGSARRDESTALLLMALTRPDTKAHTDASSFTSSLLKRRHSLASCRRVKFAPEVVTSIKEIPSHRSLTAEEKLYLYREKSTVRMDMKRNRLECKFDGSRKRADKALEESAFFFDHRGKLVHPAHWVTFVQYILPSISRDTCVPGFASFGEYFSVLMEYAAFYESSLKKTVSSQSHPREKC